MISPLELPFSSAGGTDDVNKPDVTSSSQIDAFHSIDDPESNEPASPFMAKHKADGALDEKNSWFLVQLPTRLPPMQKGFSSNENNNGDAEGADGTDGNGMMDSTPSSSDATTNVMNNISEVAVPPVTTSGFDNGLDKIAPGMVGKILVYKSGKTVLVMDGPGDKITMNVNEGLSCTFHQQAVTVNVKEGQYVTLGDVNKSIVISPDLTNI